MKLHALMKEHFPAILCSYVLFFLFQQILHQITNTYNDDGNGNRVGRSG